MGNNREQVCLNYQNFGGGNGEEDRATASRGQSLEFHYTKKAMGEYINKNSRVLEIGCGTGYYGMYFADKCKEYVGIDLFPPHIQTFQHKINNNKLSNVSCRVGDATNLKEVSDNSFDIVMCLGPMYHLPSDERELVFKECRRVCKPGGIAAFAYINKIGVYVGACVAYQGYPNARTSHYVFDLGRDDDRPDVFFFTMPEEIEAVAARYHLTKIRNLGTDSFITMNIVNQMSDEQFAEYMRLADEMAKHESCTGMSNHALLICRRN